MTRAALKLKFHELAIAHGYRKGIIAFQNQFGAEAFRRLASAETNFASAGSPSAKSTAAQRIASTRYAELFKRTK